MTTTQIPAHLSGLAARGLASGERVGQFEIGGGSNFVYLIADWDRRGAAVVDPQADLARPYAALRQHGLALTSVLLTHSHSDHTAGVGQVLRDHPGVPLRCHPEDVHRLDPAWPVQPLRGGDVIAVGAVEVEVLHTPGHTSGGVCFLVRGDPAYLLTGDTLLIGDCGRCDLDTGSVPQMFESLQGLKGLPGDPVVLPGHHYARECASTLERERASNGPLRCRTAAELGGLP